MSNHYEVVMGPAAERAVLAVPYEERERLAKALRTELLNGPNADKEVWFDAGDDRIYKATPLNFGAYVVVSRPMTGDELGTLGRQKRRQAAAAFLVIDIVHPAAAFTSGPKLVGSP